MLSSLSRWAMLKHKIQLVVVSGWYGTELSRELSYQLLGQEVRARRITTNVWWDLSLPLAILGYQDKKRNLLAWFWLLIKATLRLLLGVSNPHVLIVNINYSNPETAKYLSSFLKPYMLLITNYKERLPFLEKLVKLTKNSKGKIICAVEHKAQIEQIATEYANIFTFGNSNSDLIYTESGIQEIKFEYNEQKFNVKRGFLPGVKSEMIAGSVALALLNNVKMVDALYALVKFQLPQKFINKLKVDLHS